MNGLGLYVERLWDLTRCEFKLREQSTILGFGWTLLQPLLMFLVLYGLFTKWMGNHTTDYASYLLVGIVQYGFFNNGSTVGLSSLGRRRGLLLNFRIPRDIVVLSSVLSVAVSYMLEILLILAFYVALGGRPHATWLLLPVLFALHLVLVAGLAFWLSVPAARYPDCERIWTILLTAGFFLTPIFYTLDTISPLRRKLLMLNPMTHVIEMTRSCLIRGEVPSLSEAGGLALVSAILCALGWAVFKRNELKLSDYLAI